MMVFAFPPRPRTTFVLVHGGWHGAWCWSRLTFRLRRAGYDVSTPTLVGMGERVTELTAAVSRSRHIKEIVTHLESADLWDVVLVGHSYSGAVVVPVADQLPTRIRQLILIDGWLLGHNESIFDAMGPGPAAQITATATMDRGVRVLPPPSAERLGITDPALAAYVEARLTPHPLRTLEDRHPLNGTMNTVPSTYIACAAPPVFHTSTSSSTRALTLQSWSVLELTAPHDCMITHPARLAQTLLEAAR